MFIKRSKGMLAIRDQKFDQIYKFYFFFIGVRIITSAL